MRTAVFALGAAIVIGSGVAACNAVLGIDKAVQESDAGDGGVVGPSPTTADPLDCANYCKVMAANCGGTAATAEYLEYLPATGGGSDPCLYLCNHYLIQKKGTYVPESDPAPSPADTLACRLWHAHAAGKPNAAATHCRHAGPLGSTLCGDPCVAFCNLDFDYCVDDKSVNTYASQTKCESVCGNADGDAGFPYVQTTGDLVDNAGMQISSGNTLNCRLWHLETAVQENDPTTHCPHTGFPSGPCAN